jgi:Uma2 family endonuclease
MPPCGDDQQDVAVSVVAALHRWSRRTGDYVVGGNEAGLLLDGEARGADAAVWRRASLPARTGGFRTVAPILAVEVGGLDEGEPQLREKARWYFAKGVKVVWLVLPKQREVVVLVKGGRARRVRGTARVPPSPHLPGLELAASDCFDQL